MPQLKLLTVITEALLAKRLIEELEGLGVTGYSISEVKGKGAGPVSASEWEGRNRKIETLVPKRIAEKILEHLEKEYFEDFSVIAYTTDATVVRSEKFDPSS